VLRITPANGGSAASIRVGGALRSHWPRGSRPGGRVGRGPGPASSLVQTRLRVPGSCSLLNGQTTVLWIEQGRARAARESSLVRAARGSDRASLKERERERERPPWLTRVGCFAGTIYTYTVGHYSSYKELRDETRKTSVFTILKLFSTLSSQGT
jgi:hypothetical protein